MGQRPDRKQVSGRACVDSSAGDIHLVYIFWIYKGTKLASSKEGDVKLATSPN
jgi:hypothetical protein